VGGVFRADANGLVDLAINGLVATLTLRTNAVRITELNFTVTVPRRILEKEENSKKIKAAKNIYMYIRAF
jgi:hypothetical protein